MSFLHPVTSEVLAELPPPRAAELRVMSKSHANLFDLRLHTLRTCPFLAYIPKYLLSDRKSGEWADWLWAFFWFKHTEEGNCKCKASLAEGLFQIVTPAAT